MKFALCYKETNVMKNTPCGQIFILGLRKRRFKLDKYLESFGDKGYLWLF